MFHVPHQWRVRFGKMGSDDLAGNNGAFCIPTPDAVFLNVIASHGGGWEHVSVSTPLRVPTWDEMCFIKDMFWDDTDCVVQYHPPKADYVNQHPHCLHMWRPLNGKLPRPPKWMVGK
jgi:hypothetical protein